MKKQTKSNSSKQTKAPTYVTLTPQDKLRKTMQEGGDEARSIAAAMSMGCETVETAYAAGWADASIPLPESTTHVALQGHGDFTKYRVQMPVDGHRVTIGYAPDLVVANAMARGAMFAFAYCKKAKEYDEFVKGASTKVTSVPTPTTETLDLPDEFQDLLDFASVMMVDGKWVDSDGNEVVVSLNA